MRNLRAIIKSAGVVIFTIIIYIYFLTGYLILKLSGRNTETWRNKILEKWGKLSASILSLNISVKGNPPEPPFLLVCNHLSYLDIIVCYATTDTTIVSKAEVASWPVLGFIAKTIGVVFIDRSRKKDITRVINEITENVNERQGITIYAEGTTSSGDTVKRFKPSLLQPAADGRIPVSAAAIKYEVRDQNANTQNDVCWWDDQPLALHFYRFAKLRRTDAEIRFSDKIFLNEDRKELAAELHNEVKKLYGIAVDKSEMGSAEFQ